LGAPGVTMRLVDDPHATIECLPARWHGCQADLAGAREFSRQRRQVVQLPPPPKGEDHRVPGGVAGMPVLLGGDRWRRPGGCAWPGAVWTGRQGPAGVSAGGAVPAVGPRRGHSGRLVPAAALHRHDRRLDR
jgi:hypothetical protein